MQVLTEKNADRWIAGALFAVCATLYVALPTRDLYWDGAGFALAVDHPGWFSAIAPNHPLYIGLGRAVHTLLQYVLPGISGISVLQALNGVIGAMSVALFYLTSTDLIAERINSVLITVLFAVCATWWKFTTDADAYILPVLLLLITARYLLPARSPRPVLVAVLHTCAMLFHELAVWFVAPALIGLYVQSRGNRRARLRNAMVYLVTASGLSSATYYGCFYIATGESNISGYIHWITYHTPDSSFSFDLTRNLWLSILGTVRLLVGGRLNAFDIGAAIPLALVIGVFAIGMIAVRRARPIGPYKRNAEALPLLCSWILVYIAFLFFWLPQNTGTCQ